jgi:signal peptidase I
MLDLPFILLSLTLISGLIWGVDSLFFSKQRRLQTKEGDIELPILVDYAKSLFPVFIIVLLLRSFVAQLFMVPSGSLEPTVKPGDFVLVNQFAYGLRIPIWNKVILKNGEPKRGDIVVFHWVVNPKVDFIKRVIGVPGDKVSYINKVFYINGKPAEQTFLKQTLYGDSLMPKWIVHEMEENLQGVKHNLYICPKTAVACPGHSKYDFYNVVIPKGEYLMVGDNRDDSDDGRFWGFTPDKYLVGKAKYIVFSWNSNEKFSDKIQWKRIGLKL